MGKRKFMGVYLDILQVSGVWKHLFYHVCFTSQSFCFHFLSESSKGGSVLGVNLLIKLLCWEVNQRLQSIKSTTISFPTVTFMKSSNRIKYVNNKIISTFKNTVCFQSKFILVEEIIQILFKVL